MLLISNGCFRWCHNVETTCSYRSFIIMIKSSFTISSPSKKRTVITHNAWLQRKKLSYPTPLEDSRNVMSLFLTDNVIGGGTDSKQIIWAHPGDKYALVLLITCLKRKNLVTFDMANPSTGPVSPKTDEKNHQHLWHWQGWWQKLLFAYLSSSNKSPISAA